MHARDTDDETPAELETSVSAAFERLAEAVACDGGEVGALLDQAPAGALGRFDHNGRSLLMIAIAAGSARACRLLLARGADACEATFDGDSPLVLAAVSNRADLVSILCEAGARDDRVHGGASSLLRALRARAFDAAQMLLRYGASLDAALAEAAAAGDAASCELCWALGARAVDQALIAAAVARLATTGRVQAVQFLLACGADPSQPAPTGRQSLLHLCAARDDAALVALLLRAGADLCWRDGSGQRADEVARPGAAAVLRSWQARQAATRALREAVTA